jgi:uncharacterized Ntn-hydrolase superfamily protein
VTFSLVGRCDRTGSFGAIVSSSSPAVAARCAWARAGVGGACTQNVTDPSLGNALLDRLAAGDVAGQAVETVVAAAAHAPHRQLTAVGAEGNGATYSGAATLGLHAEASGPGWAAAGNLLADAGVPEAMGAAFASDPGAPLGSRLIAALRAARDAGGEEGPVHSAGMLVVDRVAWPVTDLRVDWTEADPVEELAGLWELWAPMADDYVMRALEPGAAPSYGVPGDE